MTSSTFANFVRMTVFFSINHGCIVAVLGFAYGLIGDNASYLNGSLYIAYALTALLLSTALLDTMGARHALISSMFIYCVYVLTVPLALITPATASGVETLVSVVGGIIGGFAAGYLWTAQGTYFALSAKHYAAEQHIDLKEANTTLAAVFAGIFLGLEVLLKILPTTLFALDKVKIHLYSGDAQKTLSLQNMLTLILYFGLALAASFGMLSIRELRPVDEPLQPGSVESKEATLLTNVEVPRRRRLTVEKVTAAIQLWWEDPTVLLLAPIQITFGVCAVLLANDMTAAVVKPKFGDGWLTIGGPLTAIIATVAGVAQVPFKLVASKYGKVPLMLLGQGAFIAMGFTMWHLDNEALGAWGVIVPLYVLQGLGRACYEGTNKALYADFFPGKSAAAFSNIIIANGGASAVLNFAYPQLKHVYVTTAGENGKALAVIAFSLACFTVCTYLLAELLHRQRAVDHV